jgi:hypothetical protein
MNFTVESNTLLQSISLYLFLWRNIWLKFFFSSKIVEKIHIIIDYLMWSKLRILDKKSIFVNQTRVKAIALWSITQFVEPIKLLNLKGCNINKLLMIKRKKNLIALISENQWIQHFQWHSKALSPLFNRA